MGTVNVAVVDGTDPRNRRWPLPGGGVASKAAARGALSGLALQAIRRYEASTAAHLRYRYHASHWEGAARYHRARADLYISQLRSGTPYDALWLVERTNIAMNMAEAASQEAARISFSRSSN